MQKCLQDEQRKRQYKTFMIEVKASAWVRKDTFEVSLGELVTWYEYESSYWVVRLLNVAGDDCTVIVIKDMIRKLKESSFKLQLLTNPNASSRGGKGGSYYENKGTNKGKDYHKGKGKKKGMKKND